MLYAIGERDHVTEKILFGGGENWGLTQGKEQFTNEYYEARLGIAKARLEMGRVKEGDESKKHIGYAELEI